MSPGDSLVLSGEHALADYGETLHPGVPVVPEGSVGTYVGPVVQAPDEELSGFCRVSFDVDGVPVIGLVHQDFLRSAGA